MILRFKTGYNFFNIQLLKTSHVSKMLSNNVWGLLQKPEDNLESEGNVRKNKKRALKTVKGDFVW